ncbi:MAG: IgGFc-binding protein [Myxococcaceae bacterium]|nr:IgGFc-binding protein [Myxococcaceae bacterium]
MRRLLVVTPALMLAVTACREKPKFTPPQDAGPLCEGTQQLINGECRFVCQRDGDCAAGEGCNLFTGQCQVKAAPPDAGPPPGVCTTGAVRCSADRKNIETCSNDDPPVWQTTTMCPPPNGFCQNEKCLVCQPGQSTCASMTELSVCLDDGSATRSVTCSGAATCQNNECRECTPNTYRCNPTNTSVQECKRTADESATWQWTNVGDNFDGACITGQCRVGGPNGFECVPPACFPGQIDCLNSSTQRTCSAMGAWTDTACPAGRECQAGVCVDECADAVAAKSYFGCDYWTAIQDNSVDPLFKGGVTSGQGTLAQMSDFAFAVTNRSTGPAQVTVTRWFAGAVQTVASVTVPGRDDPATKGLATIAVPWQTVSAHAEAVGESATGLARYGYRIQSTKPLTVYQFNPLAGLKFTTRTCTGIAGQPDCNCDQGEGGDALTCAFLGDLTGIGVCNPPPGGGSRRCQYNTFSNDASLLLPAHILGLSHVALTEEETVFATNSSGANVGGRGNGYLNIVVTENNTTVTVRSSAVTRAGGSITAMAKGTVRTFNALNAYDVLQFGSDSLGNNNVIECSANPFGGTGFICRQDNDLTGTVITSDKPVAVFGGSSCGLKPYNRVACDHVEEQIFPFATWGTSFVAQKSNPLKLTTGGFATNSPPDHYKIVSGCPTTQCPNGTNITITPANAVSSVLPPNTRCAAGSNLGTGTCRLVGISTVEFKSSANFRIEADQPISVAWFLPGQGPTSSGVAEGDPSMILLPPIQQWRTNYTVLAGRDFVSNYLGIAVDNTRVLRVEVDGVPVTGLTNAIAGTNYVVKNHAVTGGTHTINVIPRSPQPMQPDGGAYTSLPGAGITVYGYDSYVSYGYTGGLDLQSIVTGINPGG